MADFIDAVNRTRQDDAHCEAVHRLLITPLHERTTPEYLRNAFPEHIVSHRVGPAQITRNLNRGSRFTAAAKMLVRLTYADSSTEEHVFLMAREGKVWKVNDWLPDDDYTMVDIGFE